MDEPGRLPSSERGRAERAGPAARVLYVEGSAGLAELAQRVGLNLDVVREASPTRALARLDSDGDFALVICDENINGSVGLELLAAVSAGRLRMYAEDHSAESVAKGQTRWTPGQQAVMGQAVFDAVFRLGRLQPLVDDDRVENIFILGHQRVLLELTEPPLSGEAPMPKLPEFTARDNSRRDFGTKRLRTGFTLDLRVRLEDLAPGQSFTLTEAI